MRQMQAKKTFMFNIHLAKNCCLPLVLRTLHLRPKVRKKWNYHNLQESGEDQVSPIIINALRSG